MNEYIEAINTLNEEHYNRFGENRDYIRMFSFETTGTVDTIKFGELYLWDSESDGREWDEDKNDYEPLVPYLKRVFNEEIDKLYEHKF